MLKTKRCSVSICWRKEGREKEGQGGREGGRKGAKKGARKRRRKKEREGGRARAASHTSPASVFQSRISVLQKASFPNTTVTSIVQSYGPFRNQNVLACFHMIEKQILTFFNL